MNYNSIYKFTHDKREDYNPNAYQGNSNTIPEFSQYVQGKPRLPTHLIYYNVPHL